MVLQSTEELIQQKNEKLHSKSRLTSTWIGLASFRKYSGSVEVCLALDRRTKEELFVV